MPQVQTKYFGQLDYTEDAVIEFPAGLPGFETERRFVLVEQPANKPIVFMQSLSRGDLCFVALPVLVVDPAYRLSISVEDLLELGLAADRQPPIGQEVLCLSILSLSEDRPPTANLLSPVVVNLRTRAAAQAIQTDGGYSLQHPLFSDAEGHPCW